MKKSKKVLNKLLVVVIILICGMTIFSVVKTYNEENKKELEENFTWNAKYIWFEDERDLAEQIKANEWVCFRKTIEIVSKKDTKNVTARIAVDSKYWLYINGEIVVREGGLKRGQKPSSTYYDEVPLD